MSAMDANTVTPESSTTDPDLTRPGEVCRRLLQAMDASEGRRKRRKRNTEPDTIGMGIKRDLLARAAEANPDPDAFEGWLLEQVLAAGPLAGATRAMALEVLADYRVALASPDFRAWLAEGAPSDDAAPADGPAPHAGDSLDALHRRPAHETM